MVHEEGKETRQGYNNVPGIEMGKEDKGKENCQNTICSKCNN